MYNVTLRMRSVERFEDKIKFVFPEYDEMTDFIHLAMARCVGELEINITKEEEINDQLQRRSSEG